MTGPGRAIVDLTRERPVIACTWYAVLLVFVANFATAHDDRVWVYLTFVAVLTGVLAVADRAVGFSDRTLWLLLAAGTAHLCGGLLPTLDGGGVLYDQWIVSGLLRTDQAVHAFGSAVAAIAMWEVLGTFVDHTRMKVTSQAMLAVLGALGKGALNEVLEFVMAMSFADNIVGGYSNTGWDLVFNMFGAAAAAAFLLAFGARRAPLPRVVRRRSSPAVAVPELAQR